MFKEIKKQIEWNGSCLEISTGKIACQADGAVVVKMGHSMVLCTVVGAKTVKEGMDFFPLTVHYREMAYAAGKIPGGFFKREGKGSEKEVLTSRLIDRPIRPLFHPTFFNETQIICTVISFDPLYSTDILAIIGASAALGISGLPFRETIAASRVGLIDGVFVLNPGYEALKNSDLDLVIAGTKDSVMMVESEAMLLSETKMLEAIEFGHVQMQPVITLINDLVAEIAKPKLELIDLYPIQLEEQIRNMQESEIKHAFSVRSKVERSHLLKQIASGTINHFADDNKFSQLQINTALEEVKANVLRQDLINSNTRIDGRRPDEIRHIQCETALLPNTHGSSLFTRGETQSLVAVTLGTNQDEQIVDCLEGEYKERFMLDYIFPPYSVGEAAPLRAPSRREIGHGKLGWRAINRLLPNKAEFPYAIRVVSEITGCNGSSSMATICGASMALMNAGVKLKTPVAGIAMGLIKEGEKFIVLSDIISDEDAFGDMDFKVAGTKEGITALQMDIKITGITISIMKQALAQAKIGLLHILSEMNGAISTVSEELSANAPMMINIKINKDKIRDIIGPGGKIIREICETTSSKIDISDDGVVSISAVGKDKVDAAVAKIKAIALDPTVGDIFDGTVVKILDAGAFINFVGSKDGFLHISEISNNRVESVAKVLKIGDKIKVKFIGIDKGKAKLTMKNLDGTDQADGPVDSLPKTENSLKKTDNELEATVNSEPLPFHDKIEDDKKQVITKKWHSRNSEEVKSESSGRKYFN